MRLLLLAPADQGLARGNQVTVTRWARGLRARGHELRRLEPGDLEDACGWAELVHAHHAVHCGPAALACAARGLPVVVSLGGTDLNGGPGGAPDPRAREVFRRARFIVGPFVEDGERLRAAVPEAAPFRRVRRGVPIDAAVPAPAPGRLRALMAGGIRRVKGQLDALRWLDRLATMGLELELEIAGPVIETDYAARLDQELAARPRARYLGELEAAATRAAMIDCDLLLNASLHEGASNALLEALALGRPVIARRAAGNREMLAAAPREAALLIDDDDRGLEAMASFLRRLRDADREAIAAAARAFVRAAHDPDQELDELEAVYREATTR